MAAIFKIENGGLDRSELGAELYLYLSRLSCSRSMKLAKMCHKFIRKMQKYKKKIKMAVIFKMAAVKTEIA